jgi:hypothetical protein
MAAAIQTDKMVRSAFLAYENHGLTHVAKQPQKKTWGLPAMKNAGSV